MSSGGACRDVDPKQKKTGEDKNGKTGVCVRAPAASWDDDPFIDLSGFKEQAGELDEWSRRKSGKAKSASAGRKTESDTHGNSKDVSCFARTRSDGGRGIEGGGRRRTTPLTSIFALFGGGSNGASTNTAKPKTGSKRPRPLSTAGQPGRMKPPLPPPTAAGATTAGATASFDTFSASEIANHNPLRQLPIMRSCNTSDRRTKISDHKPDARKGGVAVNSDDDGVVVLGVRRQREDTSAASFGRDAAESREGGEQAVGGLRSVGRGVECQLWPDKYRPRDVSGLAVHTKKVDEVRHWMTMALAARPGSGTYRLLALVGPPGSAKSTMVRLLAEDMGVNLAEWEDTSGQGAPAYRPRADGPALAEDQPGHELGSSYLSPLDSFEEFMRRSSYRSLPLLASKPNGVAGLAGGGRRSAGGEAHGVRSMENCAGSMVLVEDLPMAHGDEKKDRLRRLMAQCARSSPCPIVLVWSQASEHSSYQSQLEQVLSRETLRLPGVQVTTCNPINARRPLALLRLHLKGVLALEGVSDPGGAFVEGAVATCRGDIRHALLNLQVRVVGGSPNSTSTALFSNGSKKGRTSGRAKKGAKTSATRKPKAGPYGLASGGVANANEGHADVGSTGSRDTFLSQFHALGKLLYAKRSPSIPSMQRGGTANRIGSTVTTCGGGVEERGVLGFVPEEVLAQGSMGLDRALAFLQYHCVDFYTNEEDLAEGLGYMSDADLFAARMYDSSTGSTSAEGVFPERYAESIASRATAFSNRHPAKSRMRPFGAPKSFEMRRNRAEASDALRSFVGDAWDASGGDLAVLWAPSRHPKDVVDTELLPAARLITGEWRAEAALRALLQRFMLSKHRQQQHLSAVKDAENRQLDNRVTASSTATETGTTTEQLTHPDTVSTSGRNASATLPRNGSQASPVRELTCADADLALVGHITSGGTDLIRSAVNKSALGDRPETAGGLLHRGDWWGGGGVAVGREGILSLLEDDEVSRDAVHNDDELLDDMIGEF